MEKQAVFVGIDVAKGHVDVAVRPSGEHWQPPTSKAALGALVERLRGLAPALVVILPRSEHGGTRASRRSDSG